MIPKTIHYCWFGKAPKNKLAISCIKSWRKYCPSFQIIEWNEDNYNIDDAPLYVQQAYQTKKWAFVTDYVRLDVINKYGGVYFDTDVEVIRPIEHLLVYDAFYGFEDHLINTGEGFGSVAGHPLLQRMMNDYREIPFLLPTGYDSMACPSRNSHVFEEYGFALDGNLQVHNNIALLPSYYFAPGAICKINTQKVAVSIHHFSGSWIADATPKQREQFRRKKRREIYFSYIMVLPRAAINKIKIKLKRGGKDPNNE